MRHPVLGIDHDGRHRIAFKDLGKINLSLAGCKLHQCFAPFHQVKFALNQYVVFCND